MEIIKVTIAITKGRNAHINFSVFELQAVIVEQHGRSKAELLYVIAQSISSTLKTFSTPAVKGLFSVRTQFRVIFTPHECSTNMNMQW